MEWIIIALAWAFTAVTVVLAVRAQRAARQVRWQAERARMSHQLRESVFAGLPPLPEQPMHVLVEGEACDDRPGASAAKACGISTAEAGAALVHVATEGAHADDPCRLCDELADRPEGEWIEKRRLCDPDPIRYWRPTDVHD